ncbi:MAG: FAD-binding oxidoreductase [bacterium]
MENVVPQKFITKVAEKYSLTEDGKFVLVKIELTEQNNHLVFQAGQYVSIKINENGERRSYSIASTPEVDHGITIVVDVTPDGLGSKFIQQLIIGQDVEILAPLGNFVVEQEKDNLLFVATGSGIVPLYAMINDLLINKQNKRQIRLHWGMHDESDLFWFDNLGRLAEEHSNFVFDVVLSSPKGEWTLCRGHVQDCLLQDLGNGVLKSGWEAYLCGNPKMIEEVSTDLQKLGMKSDKIKHEKFS